VRSEKSGGLQMSFLDQAQSALVSEKTAFQSKLPAALAMDQDLLRQTEQMHQFVDHAPALGKAQACALD
jgi:hypothetical protein